MEKKKVIAAALIAAGLVVAGMFMYLGLREVALKDRAVTVKGLSTRDVMADYVVWPLEFQISGNDLKDVSKQMDRIMATAKQFFLDKGFQEKDIRSGNTSVEDQWASVYGERKPASRYCVRHTMVIATADVERVLSCMESQNELLGQGVVLNSYQWNTDYQFRGLNELKPEMIEEATKNARAVAQKFADDAQCSLGTIRRASQGQFSVDADNNQPWMKHVRVVTTVDYTLR